MARKAGVCCIKVPAPGGGRTRDLRITSPLNWAAASTAYKYDALTNCATGADCTPAITAATAILAVFNSTREVAKRQLWARLVLVICIAITSAVKRLFTSHRYLLDSPHRAGARASSRGIWKALKKRPPPNVGLEPTTLRLRVSCSSDWASRASTTSTKHVSKLWAGTHLNGRYYLHFGARED